MWGVAQAKKASLTTVRGSGPQPEGMVKRVFLKKMKAAVPWRELAGLTALFASGPGAKGCGAPFASKAMLRIRFLQQWFVWPDLATEETLDGTALLRDFTGLDVDTEHLLDESTILRFRHLLEQYGVASEIFTCVNTPLAARRLLFKVCIAADVALNVATRSGKNKVGEREPELDQPNRGGHYCIGMRAHIAVDAAPSAVDTLPTTVAANTYDVMNGAQKLARTGERQVLADSSYRRTRRYEEVGAGHPDVRWNVAIVPIHRWAFKRHVAVSACLLSRTRLTPSTSNSAAHECTIAGSQRGRCTCKRPSRSQIYNLRARAFCTHRAHELVGNWLKQRAELARLAAEDNEFVKSTIFAGEFPEAPIHRRLIRPSVAYTRSETVWSTPSNKGWGRRRGTKPR